MVAAAAHFPAIAAAALCDTIITEFGRRAYYSLLYLFFLLTLVTCIVVVYNYWTDYEAITALYKKGQVMPTPMRHIRFSLTVALAAAAGLYLAARRFYWRWPEERYLFIGGSLSPHGFLFLYDGAHPENTIWAYPIPAVCPDGDTVL